MVQINFASREVNCKVVFYGPGRCGKTTNLQIVHAKAPVASRGDLVSIATETDRTLYFDFLPLDLGSVAGMRTKFSLYTVPGQVYYDQTRKLVLQGADGVVFVADSNPEMMQENLDSLENLSKNLAENGLDLTTIPLVLQFNKRDLPNAVPVEELNAKLNRHNWATVNAIAVNGDGVFQTLKLISQAVIRKLNENQGDAGKPRAPVVKAFRPAGAPVLPPPPGGLRPPSTVSAQAAAPAPPAPPAPARPSLAPRPAGSGSPGEPRLNAFSAELAKRKAAAAQRLTARGPAPPAPPDRSATWVKVWPYVVIGVAALAGAAVVFFLTRQ